MTMFVNLHSLPSDQAMYTLTLAWGDEMTEEVDVVARDGAKWSEVVAAADALFPADPDNHWSAGLQGAFVEGFKIEHIVNQSSGNEVYES